MALRINDVCANCGPCEDVCPNNAIQQGDGQYVIDPERCTECVGHYDEPQCLDACPLEAAEPDPEHIESREELQAKFERLQKG